MSDEKRETRWFWAHDAGRVEKVRGLTCAPMNTGYWWVPSLGLSMAEGSSLFADTDDGRRKAVDAARMWIDEQRTALDRKARALMEVV